MIKYALLSALVWLAVTLLSHGFLGTGGFFYDLPNREMPFGRFFVLYSSAFIIYLAVILKVSRIPSNNKNIFILIFSAIMFRMILLPGVPVHENDIYRYIWDGKAAITGINPYQYPQIQASIKPTSQSLQVDFERLKSLRDEDPESYRRISFKDISTIYPPLAQAAFAFAALMAPGSILFLKTMFVLFDTGVILLLFLMLKSMKQNPLYTVIYAWNPLVLKEFANSGHYDSLALLCVIWGAYMMIREKWTFSGAALGLGVIAKFYPLIFIPFFLIKREYRAFFFSIIIVCAGYLPFFLWGQADYTSIFSGLKTYAQEWVNNGFIYSLIIMPASLFSLNPAIIAKIICLLLYAAIWILIFFDTMPVLKKMFCAVTMLFLLSPVGFPWYFCWVIPFLCIYRNRGLILLSYLLILYYFIFTRDIGGFTLWGATMGWLMLMQYLPFYLFLLFELLNKYRLSKATKRLIQ